MFYFVLPCFHPRFAEIYSNQERGTRLRIRLLFVDGVVRDLALANNPFIGIPNGSSEVELAVDVYFPATSQSLEEEIRGLAAHSDGWNRLMLDNHVEFKRDRRIRKR